MKAFSIVLGVAIGSLLVLDGARCLAGDAGGSQQAEAVRPRLVRDLLWVWGNPEMTTPGRHTRATFAQAGPAERAQLLGLSNIILAGPGLPSDDQQADAWTREASGASRLVWEISADGGGPPFTYAGRMAQVRRLIDSYPKIEGVLLDDMSTVMIDKGFKPEHIRDIRQLLPDKYAAVRIWGAVYTMSLDRPGIDEYVKLLDVILLATWHAKDIVKLKANVERCHGKHPGKPIVLCLYMYDYGDGRPMPKQLMAQQCDAALELAQAGRVSGIVFLTITNDAEVVEWTADWIKRVGHRRLGLHAPAGAKQAPSGARSVSPACLRLVSQSAVSPETTRLHIGDGSGWHFTGGPWKESDGVIFPPDQRNLHSRAFLAAQSFSDLTAEFEFNGNYRETGTGGAGLIFRAAGVNRFWMVYFPWGGQQLRAKHFWAMVVKAEGDGYLRSDKSVWVPGLPSETDRWYKVRLEARGPTIDVCVDGRRALSVRDESAKSGAVGLAGYGWYCFRNIRITGAKAPLAVWDAKERVPVHHFTVGLDSQEMPTGCVVPNGDVLLAAGRKLVRSKDKGRTWNQPETLPDKLGRVSDYGNTMFRTAIGRLIVQLYRDRSEVGKPVSEISISESTDSGLTWSDPARCEVAPGWPENPSKLVPYGPLVETQNGTLLRFLLGGAGEGSKFANVVTWGSVHCKAYTIRSTDGGKNWSSPLELDQPAWSGTLRGSIRGSLDLTEPTGVALGNTVTVLIRPIYSPTMWQCWSDDAGAHWDSASRTTFPGYAQSMIRTQSGTILVAHRYPHYSVHVSRDNGLNWDEGTIIDHPAWAMGCMVEVEPDVVLCTYMNAERHMPLLAQLVRVTPQGIRPLHR